MNCPECQTGKLYEKKEVETGFTIKRCFACGYYEADSPAHKENPELGRYLFKKYFPTEKIYQPSAEFRHLADSAEDWTKPEWGSALLHRRVILACVALRVICLQDGW